MVDGPSLNPTFNFHSEATLQKRFKTPESRKAAIKTIERAAGLMDKIAADLATEVKRPKPSLDRELKNAQAASQQQAIVAAHKRFDIRREAIIKARDNDLQKIERKQFMPARRHAEPEQEARFKDWARDKRAELRQRQGGEKTQLVEKQKKATEKLSARLTAEHGPTRDVLRQKLSGIEAKLARPDGLAAKMYRAAGMQQRDEARAGVIGQKLGDIDKKKAAEMNGLQDKHDQQSLVLDRWHMREANTLERGITTARELSESFSFAASDRNYTLSDLFNLAAGSDGLGGSGLAGGRPGRSISDPGPRT